MPVTKAAFTPKKFQGDWPIIHILHYNSRSERKGVMVPPVLYDWDKDGTDDILMSAFDGTYALYNGETLEEIWSTGSEFSEYESYRLVHRASEWSI